MRILLVRKSTNFELHGDRVRRSISSGFRPEADWQRLKVAHDQHYRTLDQLIEQLNAQAIPHDGILRDEPWPSSTYDMVLTVGGDGTLLTTSHSLGDSRESKARIVGIRSSDASVGYTCAYDFRTVDRLVADISRGSVDFRPVARIAVSVDHLAGNKSETSFAVLNDVLFTNQNPAATSQYLMKVGPREEFHKSSGVWISTAVGSTAGIMAAGGFAMKLSQREFQYRVRELYRANDHDYQLTGQSFDPEKQAMMIENRNEHALLALDGQHGVVSLEYGDRFKVLRAADLLLAKPPRMNW